jgi:uncharacterized protein involved in type VI secretion and phage assembly
MSSIENSHDELRADGTGPMYGVYPAVVTDNRDPDQLGRVRVTLSSVRGAGSSGDGNWARVATLMAGNHRGSWFIPDVKDEVLVAFEGGDPRRPYVVGALWNGVNVPPESMDGDGNNYRKVLRSRSGVMVTLDDQSGAEQLKLETPGGRKVTLQDGTGAIVIEDSNGNSIVLGQGGITVTSAMRVTVNAPQVQIGTALMTVDAGMAKFGGVVEADTVIANSVISASYSQGPGNIW